MKVAALIAVITLSGCASRAYLQDNPLTPAANLYNRNFVVAAPTAAGNFICGAPFFLLASGVAAARGAVSETKPSDTFFAVVNGMYLAPAMVCGTITGLAFIPFSFVCDENPWEFNFKFSKNLSTDCRAR